MTAPETFRLVKIGKRQLTFPETQNLVESLRAAQLFYEDRQRTFDAVTLTGPEILHLRSMYDMKIDGILNLLRSLDPDSDDQDDDGGALPVPPTGKAKGDDPKNQVMF